MIVFTLRLKEDAAFASADGSEWPLRIIDYTETFEDKPVPVSLHLPGEAH